ncbi:MAG: hypothetical protein ABI763_01925 [Bacteroidota bacterium]
MTTELITENIWSRLTAAAKKSKSKSLVAVAYFGKGGAEMLPLSLGSSLLVDASDKAVKSGQTCPAELLKLYYKGVKIYSRDWLHAKMFVIGGKLYIGSSNVSRNSTKMTDAIIKTSDKRSIRDAKIFINKFCSTEEGEEKLKHKQRIYREPRFVGPPGNTSRNRSSENIKQPPFYIYQLAVGEYYEYEKRQSVIGKKEAAQRRVRKPRHFVDEFLYDHKFLPQKGDIIIQVVQEGKNTFVCPAGYVIHKRRWKSNNVENTLCYVEIPTVKGKNLKFVNQKLNLKEKKLLKRSGRINKAFAEKLIALWK